MAEFRIEQADVASLLALKGAPSPSLSDPNHSGRIESGADVIWDRPDGSIGVQVTDYTVDEAALAKPGVQARGEEKRRAKEAAESAEAVKGYSMVVPGDHRRGLRARFTDKLQKSMDPFAERWLLVVAQKDWGATSASFFAADRISLDELNEDLDAMLQQSQLDKAFILLKQERVVFEWTRAARWRCAVDERTSISPERVSEAREKYFGR